MDDILLAINDKSMLHDVEKILSKKIDMKNIDDASYVIGIRIFRDRLRGILGLLQEIYINKVLEKFQMKHYSPKVAPIMKGD